MIALALLLLGCGAPEAPVEEVRSPVRNLAPSLGNPPPLPPTEHWVHQDAEMSNKAARKQWFRERHRAPPDVDWKAVERQNGLEVIARRNAIGKRRPIDEFGAKWLERGSENQAGRMMVAALSADGTSIYAGSSLGGVWRGTLQGDGWEPLGDNLYGGAHWLALFPPEGGPEVILAATDDGLVHRSVDDGATWTVPTGIPALWGVRRLVKLQDGSHTAFMVVREANGDRHRVLRSTDGAASWTEVLDLSTTPGDIWVPRDGGTDLYAVGPGTSLRHSADLGETWTVLGSLPIQGVESVNLAGSEAGAPRFYVVNRNPGDGGTLWRTDDLGQSWTQGRDINDYWGVLVASSVDPDIVAWGGVEVHRSTDGGTGFDVVNGWGEYYDDPVNKLHADIMGIDVVVDASGSETWYIGTDGGLYESADALASVENLSLRGLRVSQYYDTLTNVLDGTQVAAGAQDQGYQLSNGIAQSSDVWDFDQVLSGDYAHLTSTDGTHDWVYSVYPGFMLVQQGTEEPVLHYVEFPPDQRVAWLPRIVADPKKNTAVFFSGSRLHRVEYDEAADMWSNEVWSDQNFSGDGYEYLAGLAFAPTDPSKAYAATSYGRMFTSNDRGHTWEAEEGEGPSGHYFHGTALLVSMESSSTAWVGGSGYGGPAIYRTRNGGRTWVPFDDGLPDTLVYSLCEAPDGSGVLFAGTHTGAWRRDPGQSNEWVEITGVEAPTTIYWSCEALQTENTIRWGTYGRGIWDYQLDPDGLGCFPPTDHDGDGVDCDLDCDDTDPDVYPGAPDKPCDGFDYDCNPLNDAPDEVCAESGGCGCQTSEGGAWLWVLVLPWLYRRQSTS